ncbi:hypothetical protein TNIN_361131 [Trichonephila inaurata madagascariensis]|uniref:Uncharacterized protein n=1 Tax=Trichonephila inaurata madagascariensis TaxID=2747483 RepID=A0A8X6XJX0_9ARAC|nr:hypothetical protein TNIN_361131 [Trichonephila inaurata madagascariensis]
MQEPTEEETVPESRETKTPSPVKKQRNPKRKEPSGGENFATDQKPKSPSPVDETRAETKTKQLFPIVDKDKKIPSPTEETDKISPVTKKITELEIKEPTQEDITKGQKSKTPSPVDETKAEIEEKQPSPIIDEHITEKRKILIPNRKNTKFPAIWEKKVIELEMQEPAEKEVIAEGQKTKSPSPVDETKEEPKEKELSPVIDASQKDLGPSPNRKNGTISPVEKRTN